MKTWKGCHPKKLCSGLDDIKRKIAEIRDELQRVEVEVRAKYGQDDPLGRVLLGAPSDNEPESEEERRLIEEARADLLAGRTVSNEEIRREFHGT